MQSSDSPTVAVRSKKHRMGMGWLQLLSCSCMFLHVPVKAQLKNNLPYIRHAIRSFIARSLRFWDELNCIILTPIGRRSRCQSLKLCAIVSDSRWQDQAHGIKEDGRCLNVWRCFISRSSRQPDAQCKNSSTTVRFAGASSMIPRELLYVSCLSVPFLARYNNTLRYRSSPMVLL